MSKKLGEGNYTHELSTHLEEYNNMTREIKKLHEEDG